MSRTESLAQPKAFGKYELVARLAAGPMGDVFKAKSHGLEGFEKVLCVKVINPALTQIPQFVETLVAEAQRSVALAHASIAQVYDLGQEEETGQYYIAGEFVSGFDLARCAALRRITNQSQAQELSVYIASEIAKALDYAHRRKDYNFNNLNLVHRHLSPTNIMLSFEGEVKVTDFGTSLARKYAPTLDEADERDRLLYAAPEVARGEPATQLSDIYALGLVLYELLSGRHPYNSADLSDVRQRAKMGAVAPLGDAAEVPRQLASIVESMLVPDPAGRVSSAGSVYEELVAYIFGNNLRADTRALAFAMQELRRDETRLHPEETTQEVGMEEISLSDLRVLEEQSEPSLEMEPIQDSTSAQLPSAKLQSQFLGNERPPLPGALEEFFNSARAGRGKAILVDGPLGSGRHYLPDRLVDALGWRGNTRAFAIQASPDHAYVPFGALAEILLEALQTPDNPTGGVEALREEGVDDAMITAFRSVLGLESDDSAGKAVKRKLLGELSLLVLGDATKAGPLVVSIDRVERLDELSLEVIRDIIGRIGDMSLMLVMCTSSADMMRSAFDIGRPEALEAVRVVGTTPPKIDDISGLTVQAAILLALIGMSGQLVNQGDLGRITGFGQDQVNDALRDLTEAGYIRVPTPGYVIAGVDDLPHWVAESFTPSEIEQWAAALARYYTQRALQSVTPWRYSPLLCRLHALSGDRRQTLREAQRYAGWLEREGWIHAAIGFYAHAAALVADYRLGSPQARIEFLLNRAELALELSQLDICRATLQPVSALSEAARTYHGAIRARLLLGQMALQQDDLEEARQHFRRSAEAARAINAPDLLAFAMLGLARWHDRYGDALAAQKTLEGAMNLYNRWGTSRLDLNTRALLLNRAVRMLSRRGLHRLADQQLSDLLSLAQNTTLPMVLCRADWAVAAVAVSRADFAQARTTLLRADTRAQDHGLVALRLELLRERAVAALSDADYTEVIELCDELLQLANAHADLYSEQRARDLRATAACMLGNDVEGSLHHLTLALERALERNVPKDVYRCHLNLDRALKSQGRQKEAAEHRNAAESLAHQMRYHVG